MTTYEILADVSSAMRGDTQLLKKKVKVESLEALFMKIIEIVEDDFYDTDIKNNDITTDMDKMNYICEELGIDVNLSTVEKIEEYLGQVDIGGWPWVIHIKDMDTKELLYNDESYYEYDSEEDE